MRKKNTLLLLLLVGFLVSCQSNKSAEKVFNIADYGAKGDSLTDNVEAIQKAIDACNKAGGGQVVVPSGGVYMTSPITLASFVDLHVEANAKLLANPKESVYTKSAFKDNRGEGMMWISGENIEDVSISGQGEINGNGVAFMGKELSDSYELKPVHQFDPRPHLITIIGGKNIRITNINITNSAYWAVHLVGCNDVVVQGITLLNNLKVRNGDGIDIDHSKNVRISDCHIESGDDCICLKNRREYEEWGACENITVTNCIMTSRSCAIKIGSENMDRISHVVFDNCIIRASNRGIGIQNRDEGVVENVVFSNITIDCKFFSDVWWGKSEPIYVTAYPRKAGDHKDAGWRFPKGTTECNVGAVTNIYFSNIKCESENGVFVGGDSKEKIKNISFDQVDLYIFKRTDFVGGIYDKRPCDGEQFVKGTTAGFYFDTASDIVVRNSSVRWGDVRPSYFGEVLEQHNVDNLTTFNLMGKKATSN
ncbi:glycoside hydrolase family 28 protein [Bacteroides ihuae]|uniref:glycoside hydrolase family 28 protein n=1 Tax=Bacteroides ihuae TaxID=1852362 RepID=UPI0008DAFD96|nr:glycosyl hydrolase family 28 protein [Bacteroides ihuae]